MGHILPMRRIVIYLIRAVVVVMAAVAIVWLARQNIASVNDLTTQSSNKSLYSQHQSSFAQAATAIQTDYAQVIYQETHAPTSTQTPTDVSDNGDSGDGQITLTPTPGGSDIPSPTLP